MAWLEKILLPVDFSDRSLGAARYAAALARHFHSVVTLMHALQPPHYEFAAMEMGGPMLGELFANRSQQANQELDALVAAELEGVETNRFLIDGDPARSIVEYAHEQKIGPDHHPHTRLRPVPPFHSGFGNRQSPARCGLPCVDRRPPGGDPGSRVRPLPGSCLRP